MPDVGGVLHTLRFIKAYALNLSLSDILHKISKELRTIAGGGVITPCQLRNSIQDQLANIVEQVRVKVSPDLGLLDLLHNRMV